MEQGIGKPPLDPLDLAVDYYVKIHLLFESQAEPAAEGLLKAAKIRRSQQKNDDARKLVTDLLNKYPNTSQKDEARELLNSLPAASAPSP